MKVILLKFSIFCVIFCGLTSEAAVIGATCEFGVEEVYFGDYTCSIETFTTNDAQMVISGAHEENKTDDDVKSVYCKECTTKVPILDINFCDKFKNLKSIMLNGIKIKHVDSKSFKNCQNLIFLDLNDNKIQEIQENLLTDMPKLTHLSFHANQISSIAQNAFKNQQQLELLILSANQISSLPPKVFVPLINLRQLWLEENELTIIHSDSFGIHRHLTKVDLWRNSIDAIDEKFIENTAVNKLYLQMNVCYGDDIYNRSEMKGKLQKCFENYQPRQVTVTSEAPTEQVPTHESSFSAY